MYLKAGSTVNALLSIECNEDAPTGYYDLRLRAGSEGADLPPLLVAPFIPETIFFCDPHLYKLTPSEGEIPAFEIDSEEELSVMIHYAHVSEPLILNISSPSTIDFQILNDVLENTPNQDLFYQIKLKPKPETPQGKYNITITGTTQFFTYVRYLILNVK